jgi:hypothetical protein
MRSVARQAKSQDAARERTFTHHMPARARESTIYTPKTHILSSEAHFVEADFDCVVLGDIVEQRAGLDDERNALQRRIRVRNDFQEVSGSGWAAIRNGQEGEVLTALTNPSLLHQAQELPKSRL